MLKVFVLIPLLGLFSFVKAQEDGGTMPRWEVVELGEDLGKRVGDVEQVLAGVDPSSWDGAGAAYVGQLEQLTRDLEYLRLSSAAMVRKPEKLSVVVDTFLWLDRLHSLLGSVAQGVRRYQSSAVADLLESTRGNYAGDMERLKLYMRQLAVSSEEEMEIAHDEAQRCRTEMLSAPR